MCAESGVYRLADEVKSSNREKSKKKPGGNMNQNNAYPPVFLGPIPFNQKKNHRDICERDEAAAKV